MKKVVAILIFAVCVSSAFGQKTKVVPKDLKILEGPKWVGSLTYIDYSSGRSTSIKCNLTITRDNKKPRIWIFDYEYPDEPKANKKSELILSPDGRTFDGETVDQFDDKLVIGGSRLITTKNGTDNDKPATFRYTYEFGNKSFWLKKEVLIDGGKEWFERNRYTWHR